jgi:hypothetical protein
MQICLMFAGGPGMVRPWHRVRAAWRGARVPPCWPGGHRAGRHRWKGKSTTTNLTCSDRKITCNQKHSVFRRKKGVLRKTQLWQLVL